MPGIRLIFQGFLGAGKGMGDAGGTVCRLSSGGEAGTSARWVGTAAAQQSVPQTPVHHADARQPWRGHQGVEAVLHDGLVGIHHFPAPANVRHALQQQGIAEQVVVA